jgi:hypothetical protein
MRIAIKECNKGDQPMLRVSIGQNAQVATLKIEGKIVGPWAMELGNTWQEMWAPTQEKPLLLDIRGVTFADSKGAHILRDIVKATGAEILSDSPLTRYFAEQATRDEALAGEK